PTRRSSDLYAPNPLGDHVCGGAHEPYDVVELDPKHQPDVLLIEPFLEDRSPFAIYRRDTAPTPSGFAEIVSNYFPVLHARSIVSGTCIQSISNTVRRHDANKRRVQLHCSPSRHGISLRSCGAAQWWLPA